MKALNPLAARVYSRLRYPQVPPFPRNLVLETTSRCNLNCRMCPRHDMRRPALDMPESLFHSLIDQLGEHDRRNAVDFLALHGFGEPLLHPRLFDLIEYAGSRLPNLCARGSLRDGLRGLTLSTNAVLLDEAKAQALLDSRLTWLAVSVDGSTADTYEAMRVGASFQEVTANVQRLLELNRQHPRALPTIAIQVVASRTATPEFDAVATRWREAAGSVENVRVELKPYRDWAGQVEAAELFTPDPRPGFLYLNCGHPYHTMVIDADGRLALCCYDVQAAEGLGNANDTPLEDLWRGLRIGEIRRLLAAGRACDLSLCANCSMARKYPADALRR